MNTSCYTKLLLLLSNQNDPSIVYTTKQLAFREFSYKFIKNNTSDRINAKLLNALRYEFKELYDEKIAFMVVSDLSMKY